MADSQESRACPYCRETVKADAVRCKHCRSSIPPEHPPHGGICPYCKEEIKPDAIKCKHCGAAVGGPALAPWVDDDCGCEGAADAAGIARRSSGMTPDAAPAPGTVELPQSSSGCTGCQDGPGLVINGRWTHQLGTRTCWRLMPVKISPNGVITWKRVQWTENCLGTLVNDPWA